MSKKGNQEAMASNFLNSPAITRGLIRAKA